MKLGTIGTGFIVRNMLDGVALTEGIECEAVYSRSYEKGKALADAYGVKKVYTELPRMLEDPEVDWVYVASPNSLHFEQAKLALEYGKNVICEKPFVTSLEKTKALIRLAEERELLLIDAVPPSFLPNWQYLADALPELGRLRLVMSNFSQYSSRYDAVLAGEKPNVFTLEFAGGCLQDINFYNLYFNIAMFGKPEKAVYYPNTRPGYADTSGVLMLQYPDFLSTNVGAKDCKGINFLQIEGENGYIWVEDGTAGLAQITVQTRQGTRRSALQASQDRWLLEVRRIVEIVRRNDRAECRRRLNVTLDVMEVLEQVRKDAGILFPGEEV